MERQRPLFGSLFQVTVITMLFRCVVKGLQRMVRKICVYVQQEFDVFREFHEDKNSPLWDEKHLFEGFMKGEDYIVCVQSKKKNNRFPRPAKTWKVFPMISSSLITEERSPENFFLEGQKTTFSSTRSEEKRQDCVQLDSFESEKDLRQQVTKDPMTDQKKSRSVNEKKVYCKATVTKITPLSEIMAIMARVNKNKRARRFKSSASCVKKASKRTHIDIGEKVPDKPTVKKRRYAKVAERDQTKVSEKWSQSRKDSRLRRRKEKAFKKQRDSDTNATRSLQSSEAELRPVSPSFGQSKKRNSNQQEAVNVKKMISNKRPLPIASVNESSSEETKDLNQESLSAASSVAELVSLMEQLSISKTADLPDHVVEPQIQELLAEESDYVPGVPDLDTDDDSDAEYDLFPELTCELKSLPEQVLMLMQMLQ